MKQKNHKELGFTLIELLASTVVIVAVSTIITGIIVAVLRGSNKANSINIARQNGTYTIAQVSKMLRFADSVDAIDGASPSTCIPDPYVPFPTPYTLTKHTSVTFTNIDGGQTTIACKKLSEVSPFPAPYANEPLTIASNGASLIDTTFVQIPNGMCSITCEKRTESDAVIIGVTFSLRTVQAINLINLSEFLASSSAIEYQTSVILRNVGR